MAEMNETPNTQSNDQNVTAQTANQTAKKREPADEKTIRAATHTTEDAPPQAPPHFDEAEARETTR